MPIAAVAVAEVRRGFAADKMVVSRAGGIDDIGSEQIRASQRESVVLAVDAVISRKQVSVEVDIRRVARESRAETVQTASGCWIIW